MNKRFEVAAKGWVTVTSGEHGWEARYEDPHPSGEDLVGLGPAPWDALADLLELERLLCSDF